MKNSLQLFFLILFFSLSAFAQKEHNVWYFGTFAGITFNGGNPTFLSGGQINSYEGVASMCDAAGNLLFYTDGVTVWDKNSAPMPNGNGLLGENSSTESAIILKMPGSSSLYYIFTAPVVNKATTVPAAYSIVDMSLNGGLGDVTTKNVNILLPATEKLTYARNGNGTGYWIIYHKYNSSDYYAYQFTSAGFNTTPVISTSGLSITSSSTFNDIGYLKASPCGNQLAMANEGLKTLELFDFNNATGVVSNAYTLGTFTEQFANYGTEFSPGGNFLYCSTNTSGNIYQYNLKAGSLSAIAASKKLVSNANEKFGALQTGPDGKIYIVNQAGRYLSAINNPDVAGTACNFVDSAVACTGGVFGLPNYVAEQFCSITVNKPEALFSTDDTVICAGKCATFKNRSHFATSYQWSFPGANSSTSTDSTPTACYSTAGKYDVELIVFSGNNSDTLLLSNYITVNPLPQAGTITSSRDTLCAGTGITSNLASTGAMDSLHWQSSTDGINFADIPGATSATYKTSPLVSQTTLYRLMANNSCGTDSSNTVTVNIVPAPVAVFNYTISGNQVSFNSSGTSSNVISYAWDFGDGTVGSDANPVHNYSTADTFNVCLTVFNGSNCSYTVCESVNLVNTGIVNVKEPVFVCPNPVAGKQLTVLISDAVTLSSAQINVTDVLGQRLINTLPTGPLTLLNVGNLAAGTYFLSLQSGNNVIVRKFVKQ